MKRVLITNLYFARYTGSELHVLEVAKLFEKRGYEVTIAVFQKAYPLLEKKGSIRVIDVLNEELDDTEFDIIFIQHYPVFDFLCCKYELSYRKLVVSKLSVISELEYLPICTPEADLILCVSQECANEVYKELGMDTRIKVFKNSVSEECFEVHDEQSSKIQLNKIAVISNHVPQELLELSQLLKDECEVDFIGLGYSPRFVDAKLLKKYDLVITIGRTVQQCFALGTPVYVYDYFGGPGYINDDNFAVAEDNNFSGRGGFGKKTSAELKHDIQENYEKNSLYLEELKSIAKEKYSYDKNFEDIYQCLIGDDNGEKKILRCYKGVEKERMALYSKITPLYALPKSAMSQLYIDYGEGFNESDSIIWNSSEAYTITRKFKIDRKVKGLRFDPCDIPSECYIYKVYINGELKEDYTGRKESFLDFDPQFLIELSEEEKNLNRLCIKIVYQFKAFSTQDVSNMYSKENAELRYKLNVSEDTIKTIKEYYKMTPKNIARRILGFLKR